MATEKQESLEVEKAEVPSSPGQATENQVDPRQPPSTTPDKPLGASFLPVSDIAYKVDEESCNTKSELRILSFICHACSHSNQGPETQTLITRLKLAVGLTVSPSNITHKYQIPTITKPRETPEGWAARNVLIWEKVNDYKQGYGTVAAFEDCDPCFLMYRKFGWLHNRLLLHLQDELSVLEIELEDFDKDEAINSRPVYQRSRRKDEARPDSKRRLMLQVIKEKLEEYGGFARR